MTRVSRYRSTGAKLAAGWRGRALSLKAVVFGLVGVVNDGRRTTACFCSHEPSLTNRRPRWRGRPRSRPAPAAAAMPRSFP